MITVRETEVPELSCNDLCIDLTVPEFVKLFLKLYEEVGFSNPISITIYKGRDGDKTILYTGDGEIQE